MTPLRRLIDSSLQHPGEDPAGASGDHRRSRAFGLPVDPQPSPLLVSQIKLVLLVVCSSLYQVRRSEAHYCSSGY